MGFVNHHLWRNRRTWWVAFTVLHDGHRQERVRRSLGTQDVELARRRRDAMLREFATRADARLSIRMVCRPAQQLQPERRGRTTSYVD